MFVINSKNIGLIDQNFKYENFYQLEEDIRKVKDSLWKGLEQYEILQPFFMHYLEVNILRQFLVFLLLIS